MFLQHKKQIWDFLFCFFNTGFDYILECKCPEGQIGEHCENEEKCGNGFLQPDCTTSKCDIGKY